MLPNKPPGFPHVDDRRVLNGILLGVEIRCVVAWSAGKRLTLYRLLQSVRLSAAGSRLDQIINALTATDDKAMQNARAARGITLAG
jgi:hypothetical protein